jgi:hypothetical protein
MDMRFGPGMLEVCIGQGSLVAVWKELSKYKLDLVGVQEVRWKGSGNELAGEYAFFHGKRNQNHELGTALFVHKRIISAVKRVEFVSDRMSYIILRGLLVSYHCSEPLAPIDDKIEDVKDSLYEELEHVFDKFPK